MSIPEQTVYASSDITFDTVKQQCVVIIYVPDGEFHRAVSQATFKGWIPPVPARGDCICYWDIKRDTERWGYLATVTWDFSDIGIEIVLHLNDEPPEA